MWRLICWFLLGVPFFWLGVAIRKGRFNKWYLHTQIVPYMPPSTAYAYFPLSFVFSVPPVILALPLDSETKINLIFVTWGICFLLIVIFPFWKPNFLKPEWLLKLEARYPRAAIDMFKMEWQEMDRDEWARKIGTKEGFEELIRMVTDKYGEYDPRQKAFVKREVILPAPTTE